MPRPTLTKSRAKRNSNFGNGNTFGSCHREEQIS